MNGSNELSLEQEFKLANYKKQLTKLDSKESKKYLMATLRQMMIKDNIIKYFIQNSNL
uniref:phycobilisome degradation protein n=1 Tax=Phymatolithon calcareum TaxID=1277942 RepID=UPI0023F59467|nr:phycobilisome degradation protein [Phymatolithon calcareum]WEA76796.1 phycobilisome degradation protein [Phymatolithon calcareum]